jgi:hypothetical protein
MAGWQQCILPKRPAINFLSKAFQIANASRSIQMKIANFSYNNRAFKISHISDRI